MGSIPIVIAVGIIEDKIANDLTGDSKTKKHFEDVKNKIINHKNKLKSVVEITYNKRVQGCEGKRIENVISLEIKKDFIVVKTDTEEFYCKTEIVDKIIKVESEVEDE